VDGEAGDVAVGLEWPVSPWSREHFVMFPAAAYNGNLYPSRPYEYPPMEHEPADIGPEAPIIVTDVPRLSHEEGTPSRIQILIGDETTLCISFYDQHENTAFILLTEQGSRFGNHGLTVEEKPDRSGAVLRIEAPGVRRSSAPPASRGTLMSGIMPINRARSNAWSIGSDRSIFWIGAHRYPPRWIPRNHRLLRGPFSQNLEKSRCAGPLHHVHGRSAPFLIVHGDRDDIVPLVQSQRLHWALQDAGVESTLQVIPGEGHSTEQLSLPERLDEIAEFLACHLR